LDFLAEGLCSPFMLIDSHAHLDFPDFQSDLEDLISRARQAGVDRILAIGSGTGPGSLDCALRLAEKFSILDASIGIHPHEARLAVEEDYRFLEDLATHEKIVAWGEIGLDYHYHHSPREVQQAVFEKQLDLAARFDLPVIIHTREAEEDTLKILEKKWRDRTGVMHCFSGSRRLAETALEMGFHISFSGILTFPKAGEIRQIAAQVPLDRLLVETDAPYLAPVPLRGKRNEPAFVVETAKSLAEIKGLSLEEIGFITSANYHRLFYD
jgi:TatD DNase family protein